MSSDLATRIERFLDGYAKTAAAYDPAVDGPGERFNGPDSSMLYSAAQALRHDRKPEGVFSSIGSGCYRDWNSPTVKAEHDALVTAINTLANAR